jgi:hypothetical protein
LIVQDGSTNLHFACDAGALPLVKRLVNEFGFEPNKRRAVRCS